MYMIYVWIYYQDAGLGNIILLFLTYMDVGIFFPELF